MALVLATGASGHANGTACKSDLTVALARASYGVIDGAWWINVVANRDPHTLDRLRLMDGRTKNLGKLIGVGGHAWVFQIADDPSLVIKVATDQKPAELKMFTWERYNAERLSAAGFNVAPIVGFEDRGAPYILKPLVTGPSLGEVRATGFSEDQIADFAQVYAAGRSSGVYPDLVGVGHGNLIWSEVGLKWVLVDAGVDCSPAYFQPFGKVFDTDIRSKTTSLDLIRDEVFGGDLRATDRFRELADGLVAQMQKRPNTLCRRLMTPIRRAITRAKGGERSTPGRDQPGLARLKWPRVP